MLVLDLRKADPSPPSFVKSTTEDRPALSPSSAAEAAEDRSDGAGERRRRGAGAGGGYVGSGWDCWDLRIKLSYFNAAQGALMAPRASRRAALLDRSNGKSSLGCAMVCISNNHELTQRKRRNVFTAST